jgi:hypothetical protein
MSPASQTPGPSLSLACQDYGNRKAGLDLLRTWQQTRLQALRQRPHWKAGDGRVTLLTYSFWKDDADGRHLDALEAAILETWRHCGQLPTVLVADRPSPRLEQLLEAHDGRIRLQLEPRLQPGNLYSMSVDCNSRLHTRFHTEFVLVIQDDGFPIRPGLEEYLGRFDFIGAPYVRNKWHLQAVCRLFKCQVCNGGFSLRSHRICEMASYHWNRKYHALPDCDAVSEDYFYTKTLPLREPAYRRCIVMPSFCEALDFSYDAVFPFHGVRPPFGFHGALAFKLLQEAGALTSA